jgi:hypothetical protein
MEWSIYKLSWKKQIGFKSGIHFLIITVERYGYEIP